jgi:hypothetical protein
MRIEPEMYRPGSPRVREWTHWLVKVRRYRGVRTPTGTKTRKAMDARRAWSLTRISYSDKGKNMVSAAWGYTMAKPNAGGSK